MRLMDGEIQSRSAMCQMNRSRAISRGVSLISQAHTHYAIPEQETAPHPHSGTEARTPQHPTMKHVVVLQPDINAHSTPTLHIMSCRSTASGIVKVTQAIEREGGSEAGHKQLHRAREVCGYALK